MNLSSILVTSKKKSSELLLSCIPTIELYLQPVPFFLRVY